jgi:hypothetical protein
MRKPILSGFLVLSFSILVSCVTALAQDQDRDRKPGIRVVLQR